MKRIDPKLSKYSDQELEKIRDLLYSLGNLAIESYLVDKSGSKNPRTIVANKKDNMPNLPQ